MIDPFFATSKTQRKLFGMVDYIFRIFLKVRFGPDAFLNIILMAVPTSEPMGRYSLLPTGLGNPALDKTNIENVHRLLDTMEETATFDRLKDDGIDILKAKKATATKVAKKAERFQNTQATISAAAKAAVRARGKANGCGADEDARRRQREKAAVVEDSAVVQALTWRAFGTGGDGG